MATREPERDEPEAKTPSPDAPFLSSVLEATADGILVFDREGAILYYNRRMADIWNLPERVLEEEDNEAALERATDRVEDRERYLRTVEEVHGDPEREHTHRIRMEDGRLLERTVRPWYDHDGRLGGQVATFRDLTAQHSRREELRASRERYRSLFRLSRDGIFVLDDGARIVEVNERGAELVGSEPGELEGRSVLDLHPPSEVPDAREAIRETLETGHARLRARMTDGGGETWPAQISGTRIEIGDRTLVQAVVRDVSRRREWEQRLKSSERRYRELFERNVAGVFRTSPDGTILECNQAFADILGYGSPQELEGRNAAQLYDSPQDREKYLERLTASGELVNEELRLQRRDGSPVWVLENSFLTEDPETGETVNQGTLIDISDRVELRRELEELAYHDPLTGLANRRLLQVEGDRELERVDRNGTQAALLFLDLARFKRVNDSFGHEVGDEVLAAAGKRIRSCTRGGDVTARVGGDEFAVLLTDVEGPSEALQAAERVGECFDEPFHTAERPFHLQAKIGIALYPDHASNFAELLSEADQAMYQADPQPEEGVSVHVLEGRRESGNTVAREETLRQALADDDLALHYQPICELDGGTCSGVEGLVRWPRTADVTLRAADFVPLAERAGMIRELDRWVLREAVRQLEHWSGEAGRPSWASINLSAGTLSSPDLPGFIDRLLTGTDVAGEQLVVELTERVAMRDPESVAATLDALGELGVRVAIDDFGTGHAVLAYLKQFPADLLKLDLVFVQRLDRSARDRDLLSGIVALGQEMDMRLVAEGVENEAQRRAVEEMGVDLAQGYLLGRPAPAEQLGADGEG